MNRLQGWSTIAVLGAAATAVVAASLGSMLWDRRAEPAMRIAAQGQAEGGPAVESPKQVAGPPQDQVPGPVPQLAPAAEAPGIPSFDVVRVEPTGESVIAGRGAPGATIEMLRDGQVHARTVADQSGLFALVPPALPSGSHQIALQSIAPDGARQRSRQSVTIVISQGRNAKPLVALTAPDQPTVVLSNPEPPELQAAEAPDAVGTPKGMPAGKVAQVRIISVEAEEGGRLYVSAQAPPGATVRLYLNDTFIAPGSVGSDSKVAFAIDRGVRPGDYRVRLDEVDPVSGEVKGRAEVPFALPVTVAVPLPPPAPPVVTEPEGSVTASVSGPLRPDGTRVASTEPTGDGANTVVIPSVDTVVVSRGESLWRISQRIYGSGYRYTTIFGANQKQIKDPNRIFPGQTFVLPPEQGRAGAR